MLHPLTYHAHVYLQNYQNKLNEHYRRRKKQTNKKPSFILLLFNLKWLRKKITKRGAGSFRDAKLLTLRSDLLRYWKKKKRRFKLKKKKKTWAKKFEYKKKEPFSLPLEKSKFKHSFTIIQDFPFLKKRKKKR